eukprot:gene17521-biopygen18091
MVRETSEEDTAPAFENLVLFLTTSAGLSLTMLLQEDAPESKYVMGNSTCAKHTHAPSGLSEQTLLAHPPVARGVSWLAGFEGFRQSVHLAVPRGGCAQGGRTSTSPPGEREVAFPTASFGASFSFDLQDGYHIAGIHPAHQQSMQIHPRGELLQCPVLLFAWNDSPGIFVKVVRVVECIRAPHASQHCQSCAGGQTAPLAGQPAPRGAGEASTDPPPLGNRADRAEGVLVTGVVGEALEAGGGHGSSSRRPSTCRGMGKIPAGARHLRSSVIRGPAVDCCAGVGEAHRGLLRVRHLRPAAQGFPPVSRPGGAMGIDLLAPCRPGESSWVNPPWGLLNQVVQTLRESGPQPRAVVGSKASSEGCRANPSRAARTRVGMRLEVHWQGDDAWYLGTEAEVSGDVVPGRPRVRQAAKDRSVVRMLEGRASVQAQDLAKAGTRETERTWRKRRGSGQVTFVLGKEKGRQQVWTKRRPAILLTAVRGSRELLEVWASHRGSVEPTDSFWRLLGESRAQGPGSLGETWLKHAFGAFSCTAPLLSAVHGVNRSDWTAVADEHMRRNFGWLATMQQTMRLTGYSLATADFEAV